MTAHQLKRYFPLLVACYVAVTGIFFLLSPVLNDTMVTTEVPKSTMRLAISIIFLIAGVLFIYLFFNNKLQRQGKSVIEIRLEAIEKYDSPSILADIVRNEPVEKIRQAAQRRLEEISA